MKPMVKKKVDELRNYEEKFKALIAKRDELNAQAQSVRAERDALNEKKKELRKVLDEVRERRRELSVKIGEHKKKRDELQQKAKSLIDIKKKLRKGIDEDARAELSFAKREMRKLEMEQQTIPRPLEEEAEIIKRIRLLYQKVTELEKVVKEQKEIKLSMKEIDDAIDEAFQLANSEHQSMMLLVEERKACDEKIKELVNEISLVIGAADKKHQEFIDIKKAADLQHAKAKEMRDKILEIRATKRREREEQRRAIDELNESARKELLDKEKLEQAAEAALDNLLKKGKIEL